MTSLPRKHVIAQVGFGYWGRNILNALNQLKPDRLYLCDSDPAQRARARDIAPNAIECDSFEKILVNPDIEAVVLATPVEMHAGQTIAALKAGKHVFVEKPLCASTKEAGRIVQAARDAKRHVMVGHIYMHHPGVIELRNWIRAGKLGKIHWIRSTRCSLGPRVRTDVDVLWDYAIHDVYLIPFLMESPVIRVRADGRGVLQPERMDWVSFNLEFPKNVLMQGFVTWLNPYKERSLMVVGELGIAVFDELKPHALTFHKCGYHRVQGRDKWGNVDLELFDDGKEDHAFDSSTTLRRELEHFLAHLDSNKGPRASLEDGLTTLDLLEKLSHSAREGGRWLDV
jgi:UDP-2-acetamido-3-amino-2,3-dideoxy-glucuronate N-acetyltransferase